MSNQPTDFITIEGPADKAATTLSERGLRIVQVQGSNGCDWKNATADEYIVEVESTTRHSELVKARNLGFLNAYHVGDRDHYLAELRQDTRQALHHYVSEATSSHGLVVRIKGRQTLDAALASIDLLIHDLNFGGTK